MNAELIRQLQALSAEEKKRYANAAAVLRAIQPSRGLVVDRKLLDVADREIAQAEFARALQGSRVYRTE